MCPVGMVLVEVVLAWSFSAGQWVQVDMCYDEDASRGVTIRTDRNEEADIYQVVMPENVFWIIDE